MKIVGSAGSLGGAAGTAVSAGRPDAPLAQHLCLVRPGSASVGSAQPGDREPPPPLAPRISARVPLRRPLVHGQLLLGPRHHVRYGDMPPLAPTLLLIAFSLVLGVYFGLFGLGLMLVRRATGKHATRPSSPRRFSGWRSTLLAARFTSVPWDQLGYSQVDNGMVNQLAPWTASMESRSPCRGECAHRGIGLPISEADR